MYSRAINLCIYDVAISMKDIKPLSGESTIVNGLLSFKIFTLFSKKCNLDYGKKIQRKYTS